MSTLDVLLDGARVAVLDGVAGAGMASLTYTEGARARFPPGTPLLSVRLPVREQPYPGVETRAWMDGLLPEADIRTLLADKARLAADDLFGLLRVYGRDCAGAVSFVDSRSDSDGTAEDVGVHWLTESDLAEAVRQLPRSPFGVGVNAKVRVSLGGVQGKLALVLEGDRLGLPLGTHPSTHILKPAPVLRGGEEQWPGIVSAEAFAMLFCAELGLPVPDVRILQLDPGPALLVERYDRQARGDGTHRRLHQEDLCQALGLTAVSKYQQFRDRPSLLALVDTLRGNGGGALAELRQLLVRVAASALVGNCDGHAKNWSLMLNDGSVSLAPVYDVVPTKLWTELDTELALRISGCTHLEDLRVSHLIEEARGWGLGPRAASDELLRLGSATHDAAARAAERARNAGADADIVRCAVGVVASMHEQVFSAR